MSQTSEGDNDCFLPGVPRIGTLSEEGEDLGSEWTAWRKKEEMKLAIITSHAGADSFRDAVMSWTCPAGGTVPIFVQDGLLGMLPAYQRGLIVSEGYDLLAFFHDDTLINDIWLGRIVMEFNDPTVGLVGLGGALGHGTPSLYKEEYNYKQLARQDFMSNMEDAENHGRRFEGSCDVAVLDGFALIVRREVLEKMGGWPIDKPIGYIAYDYWLCCMTRRLGYRIRLVGVPCKHLGGRTFVKLGMSQDPKHWEKFLEAHKYIAAEFRDVLPYRVGQR